AWAAGRHDLWAAYERSQIARSLAFAAAAFGLLVILAWRRVRTGRAAPLAVALLAAVVAADGLTAARAYYVSQPAGSVRATEGIKTLADLVGPEGTWRTLNREAATWVFPPNANELFGIEALRGRSTIVPQTYAYFLGGPNQASAAGRGGASGAGGAEPSLEAAGLMSARYLIRDSFDPAFASGVFGLIARRPGAASSIRLPNLGGDARLALCQAAGDTARVNVHIPDHARLDFYFGAPAGPSGVVLELSCQGPNGRVSFRKELPPPETGRWYDESLDLSSLGGEYAELVLTAARAGAGSATGPPAGESSGGNLSAAGPQPTGQGFTGAWGGLELVLADCRAEVCQRGYIVETGRAGIVSLTIAASARDVPLEIATASGKILRWVAFPPYLRTRTIKVDMTAQERGSLAVTSDSAFTVVRSRLGPANSGVGLGDLVYAGDMYIFENPTAVEKAFVATGEAVRSLTEAGWAQAGGPGSGRPDMRCGKVRITSYEPERIALEVQADQEGWLVLQDGFYPGWRAVVDGRSEPIRVTEVGTRAVAVSAGQHAMVMEFKPESLRRGLVITVLGLAVGVLYAFAPRRKRSK
ncbi:MAG TPA: hypothetical protein VMU02_01815, partial [bacterium]|nr:hypothetical protein [bacterium]